LLGPRDLLLVVTLTGQFHLTQCKVQAELSRMSACPEDSAPAECRKARKRPRKMILSLEKPMLKPHQLLRMKKERRR